MSTRIQYLDGLRGLAILNVMFFHAFVRWENVEPFSHSDVATSLFSYGHLGVQLFFSISGYVIYMTLLKSHNLLMFGVQRYLRLAPAMLIASIFIYGTSFYLTERPAGEAHIQDFLPSLTFISPAVFDKLIGLNVQSLDGAFWSLFVEVKFYLLVAILFFVLKDKKLLGISVIFGAYLILDLIISQFGFDNRGCAVVSAVLKFAGAEYFGWFLIGIFGYRYRENPTIQNLFSVFLVSVVSIIAEGRQDVGMLCGSFVVAALFVIPLISQRAQQLLSFRFFLFMGYISYPLYLVHQNIVSGAAIKFYRFYPDLPGDLYPVPFMILVILFAYGLARFEPYLRNALQTVFPESLFGFRLCRSKA